MADPRGGTRDTPPSVQILSFSCSFWQKCCQIIGWYTPVSGWRLLWEILDPPLIEYFGCFLWGLPDSKIDCEICSHTENCDVKHHVGRASTSDWLQNSFIMVVYENIFLFVLWTENADWTLKNFSRTIIIKLFSSQSEVRALPPRRKRHSLAHWLVTLALKHYYVTVISLA